jgi:hypothetical protein
MRRSSVPALGAVIFLLAGVLTIDTLWQALPPAGLYLAILSVPMLAITKIICDRVQPLAAFGHFLKGWEEDILPRLQASIRTSTPGWRKGEQSLDLH